MYEKRRIFSVCHLYFLRLLHDRAGIIASIFALCNRFWCMGAVRLVFEPSREKKNRAQGNGTTVSKSYAQQQAIKCNFFLDLLPQQASACFVIRFRLKPPNSKCKGASFFCDPPCSRAAPSSFEPLFILTDRAFYSKFGDNPKSSYISFS